MSETHYERWDVCLADVPFEDIIGTKKRPVVVLNHSTVLDCLKATSSPPRFNCQGEYSLREWKCAGLKKPTVIRVSKRLHIVPANIYQKIGSLHPYDILKIQSLIEAIYGE